jgi:hypothetical protein
MNSGYKSRSPRKKVVVPCRLNAGGLWSDACIRNISSRGMMITGDSAAKVGSYVDIRRGTIAITGRIVWADGPRFGVRTQDDITAEALVGEPVLKQRPSSGQGESDRRAPTRHARARSAADRADQSRWLSSLFQYVCLVLFAGGFAAFAAIRVFRALAVPFGTISNSIGY